MNLDTQEAIMLSWVMRFEQNLKSIHTLRMLYQKISTALSCIKCKSIAVIWTSDKIAVTIFEKHTYCWKMQIEQYKGKRT